MSADEWRYGIDFLKQHPYRAVGFAGNRIAIVHVVFTRDYNHAVGE